MLYFVIISWELQVFLGAAIVIHKSKETITTDIDQLIFSSNNDGDVSVVTGGDRFFVLLAGEDIDSSNTGLGGTMLTGFSSGVIYDLHSYVRKNNARDVTLHG